jgi:hypothetical protein
MARLISAAGGDFPNMVIQRGALPTRLEVSGRIKPPQLQTDVDRQRIQAAELKRWKKRMKRSGSTF